MRNTQKIIKYISGLQTLIFLKNLSENCSLSDFFCIFLYFFLAVFLLSLTIRLAQGAWI